MYYKLIYQTSQQQQNQLHIINQTRVWQPLFPTYSITTQTHDSLKSANN